MQTITNVYIAFSLRPLWCGIFIDPLGILEWSRFQDKSGLRRCTLTLLTWMKNMRPADLIFGKVSDFFSVVTMT